MAYFLTADGGTESLRARVYDLSGKELGSVAVAYKSDFSAGARASLLRLRVCGCARGPYRALGARVAACPLILLSLLRVIVI
mgnify:CR=1 FL=1